ncbi:MAG: acetone carboxylase subunit gamma [Pseudomonadota bacterium]
MAEYDIETLRELKDRKLPVEKIHEMQSRFKDKDRFLKMLAIWQESVEWDDKILLPLAEHLFVVQKPDGKRIIKSKWGHEYCEAHENWKLHAKVFVRDTQEKIDEVYPHMLGCDSDWMVLREYYDPASGTLLEVEAVAPGYPVVHDFKPDIDTFYKDWLGIDLK